MNLHLTHTMWDELKKINHNPPCSNERITRNPPPPGKNERKPEAGKSRVKAKCLEGSVEFTFKEKQKKFFGWFLTYLYWSPIYLRFNLGGRIALMHLRWAP